MVWLWRKLQTLIRSQGSFNAFASRHRMNDSLTTVLLLLLSCLFLLRRFLPLFVLTFVTFYLLIIFLISSFLLLLLFLICLLSLSSFSTYPTVFSFSYFYFTRRRCNCDVCDNCQKAIYNNITDCTFMKWLSTIRQRINKEKCRFFFFLLLLSCPFIMI